MITTTDALVLRSDDGAVYAISWDLLARCKVAQDEHSDVAGYLNPQPIPPGVANRFQVIGVSSVSFPGRVDPGLPFGISIMGRHTPSA